MRRIVRNCSYGLWLTLMVGWFANSPAAVYRVAETVEVDRVPSGFPVGFCLLTHGDQQYVAYYNDDHQMVVASRRLSESQWQRVELPSKVGWDSHNYITMTMDSAGDLHLAGNMHCVPLIYFRTTSPGDIASFQQQPMTGKDEQRCTYPKFLTSADGQLLFMYRSGSSGNGSNFFNAYDPQSKTWSRFLDTPLFDGEGQRNAYPAGPTQGPDGRFHVVWVWRDTPDCATNHHLSYARSSDMKNWESAAGEAAVRPFLLEQSALWVDPIPPGGGVINGCQKLAFDSDNRPIVSYHKLDDKGHMQIYVARFQDGRWQPHPVTAWDKNIAFSGGGAMPFIGIRISNLTRSAPDRFYLTYRHRDFGSGQIVLDEATLQPVDEKVSIEAQYPRGLGRPTIDFPGIQVKLTGDTGRGPEPETQYVLRWETLEANRDRPRQPPLPPPSALQVIELTNAAQ